MRGVPTVIVGVANDLTRPDEEWPSFPTEFSSSDKAAASKYFDRVEVKVWTPGITSGNPVSVDPLPAAWSFRLDQPSYSPPKRRLDWRFPGVCVNTET